MLYVGLNVGSRFLRGASRLSAVSATSAAALFFGVTVGFAPAAHAQLQATDLYLKFPANHLNPVGHILKFTWSNIPSDVTLNGLKRTSGGGSVTLGVSTATNTAEDDGWTSGTHYTYCLVGEETSYQEDPVTHQWIPVTSPWESNHVVICPCDVAATATATADSRVDKRYGDIHYQDYPFNANPKPNNKPGVYLYRGGLYAGGNGDGSKVGRSFVKLPLVAPATVGTTTEQLYNFGGLWVFSPRLAQTGSAAIVCKRADSSTWTTAPLVWTNAPAPTGSATQAVTLSWSSQTPVSAWYQLNALQLVQDQVSGSAGNTLTAILMGDGETSSGGWAYFAANAYEHRVLQSDNTVDVTTGYGPRLLYAWGGDGLSSGGGGEGGGGAEDFAVKRSKGGSGGNTGSATSGVKSGKAGAKP